MALHLVMRCQHTKFGSKQFRASEGMKESCFFDALNSQCDLDREDTNPIFSHEIPPSDDTASNYVWLQKLWQLRRYHPDKRIEGQDDSNIPHLTLRITKQKNMTPYRQKRGIRLTNLLQESWQKTWIFPNGGSHPLKLGLVAKKG